MLEEFVNKDSGFRMWSGGERVRNEGDVGSVRQARNAVNEQVAVNQSRDGGWEGVKKEMHSQGSNPKIEHGDVCVRQQKGR